jgi:hypothetical protein
MYTFIMSRDSHMPGVMTSISPLSRKYDRVSLRGLFKEPSNKLVAARFQQLGEWSPPSRLAHLDRNLVHILIGKKPFYNLAPLLRLSVTTNKLEKSSYLAKIRAM